jgi:hypothetical protein
MLAHAELPGCLSEILWEACRRCTGVTPGGDPCLPPGQGRDLRARLLELVGSAPTAEVNWVEGFLRLNRRRCQRCTLLLLLHAIAELVPAPGVPDWLAQPSGDLDGRTPRECIDAGDYDAVFHALWMLDPPGPVS